MNQNTSCLSALLSRQLKASGDCCCYTYKRGKEISCGLHLSTPSLSKAGQVQIPEGCMSVSMPPAPPLHHAPADMKFTVSQLFL